MKQMQFKLFLEQNISDILSSLGDEIKSLKKEIREFLQNHLQGRDLDTAVNLFAYIYNQEKKGDIKKDWELFRDYLTLNLSVNRNLFVNPITRNQLENLNDRYHLNLKLTNKTLRKGPKGESLVDVSKELTELNKTIELPNSFRPDLWAGWHWVSLGCGYSGQEAAAGGHCGNTAGQAGDNIFSLRNPSNQVLLTFIVNVNNGHLGESKAVNNEKPKKELHPAIVALLSSKYIKKIEGGGYLPEKNFELEDLKYSKNLYKYFSDNLGDNKKHTTPENYLPLSWLTKLSDDVVHVKYHTIEQKTKLLEDILNVFSNYKVFDLDKDEKFTPISININLNKLIKECLNSPEAQNIKYLLDIYSKVVNIYASNKIWGSYNLERYRPDLQKEDLPEDSEGEFIDYIKKIEKINVDKSTVDVILKNILNRKLNLRDKVNLLSYTIRAAGYGYEEKPGSHFSEIITNLMHQIIRECLNQTIPAYASEHLVNYIEAHIKEEDMTGLLFTFTQKKQAINISFHDTYLYYEDMIRTEKEKEYLRLEIDNILPSLKQEFIKKGIPAKNGTIRSFIKDCIVKDFVEKFLTRVKNTLFMNYGFSKSKKRNYYYKNFNAKELIKRIISGEEITEIIDIKNQISDCRKKVFSRMIRKLKNFISLNFDKTCECAKKFMQIQPESVWRRSHKNKIKYETPDQLRSQRIKTQGYLLRKKNKETYDRWNLSKPDETKNTKSLPDTLYSKTESYKLNFKNWISIK